MMTMISTIFSLIDMIAVGCSVIGKSHVKSGKPNQDAFLIKHYPWGQVLAVADGVGSDQNSEYASSAVVTAVDDVFATFQSEDIDQLPMLLCNRFASLMDGAPMRRAGTTCIFCVNHKEAGLILGQIGDGICCGLIDDHPIVLLNKKAAFTNIVEPLTVNSSANSWHVVQYLGVSSASLMLATDGIADDILPGKEVAFTRHLISTVAGKQSEEQQRQLTEILEGWATPDSNDDKTVALYHFA